MKKIIQLLIFILLIYSSAFAQEKKDSIKKENKKQYFIGLQLGGGVGWRKHKNINDSLVLGFRGITTAQESPGNAYGFAVNFGFLKKKWRYTFGVEFNYVEYRNSHTYYIVEVDINTPPGYYFVSIPTKTKYIHQFISIPFSATYLLGKRQYWQVETILKIGFLANYFRIENRTIPNKVDLGKYPVAWIGASIGRKIIETKKLLLFVDCQINYSSIIGYKTIATAYYPNPNAIGAVPFYIDKYKSKPHNLVVPSIQFSLQYKL